DLHVQNLTTGFDAPVNDFVVTPNNRKIFFTATNADDRSLGSIYEMDIETGNYILVNDKVPSANSLTSASSIKAPMKLSTDGRLMLYKADNTKSLSYSLHIRSVNSREETVKPVDGHLINFGVSDKDEKIIYLTRSLAGEYSTQIAG